MLVSQVDKDKISKVLDRILDSNLSLSEVIDIEKEFDRELEQLYKKYSIQYVRATKKFQITAKQMFVFSTLALLGLALTSYTVITTIDALYDTIGLIREHRIYEIELLREQIKELQQTMQNRK